MKIQFIICGWWYDEFDGRKGITDFIDGLVELQKDNESIDVFWTCHKEPTKLVKDNFKYKVFENVGLEWGAYNKAFNHLNLDDDTIVFCIQDDMVIKDWSFISICIQHISNGTKIIGNGFNYPMYFEPQSEARLSYWLKTKDKLVDYVREENKHMFDVDIKALSIRGSFMCTRYDHIKEINGFEYVNKELTYGIKEDGKKFILTDPYGNTSLYLNAYKFTKYFGVDKMKWLSNEYRKSPYMIECGRGNIDLPQDKDTKPFDVPGTFLIDGPVEYDEDVEDFVKVHLKSKSIAELKDFVDSLDEEMKTWSLDLQGFKNIEEFYDGMTEVPYSILLLCDNEIIGFCYGYADPYGKPVFEVSFVVKSKHQGKGLGTKLLLLIEEEILEHTNYTTIMAKHLPNNIASHKAFLKAGYEEAVLEFGTAEQNKNMLFKQKHLKVRSKKGDIYWVDTK